MSKFRIELYNGYTLVHWLELLANSERKAIDYVIDNVVIEYTDIDIYECI